MKHILKIWPQFFQPVLDGIKTFEIRVNDRGFQNGDTVALHEYNPEKEYESSRYTGRYVEFKIGYVLPIDDKRVVFSLLQIASDSGLT